MLSKKLSEATEQALRDLELVKDVNAIIIHLKEFNL